jgi:hypothetical protein
MLIFIKKICIVVPRKMSDRNKKYPNLRKAQVVAFISCFVYILPIIFLSAFGDIIPNDYRPLTSFLNRVLTGAFLITFLFLFVSSLIADDSAEESEKISKAIRDEFTRAEKKARRIQRIRERNKREQD